MKIELVIDRLVLDGFAAQSIDGEAVRRALSAELAHALRTQKPALAGAALPRIRAAELPAAASLHSASLGIGVAQALHGALAAHAPASGFVPARISPAARGSSQ